MTHSQGPWVIQGDNIVVDGFTIGGINIEDAEKRPEEAKANLQLMASAPDMLEALEGVLHHNDAVKEAYKLPNSLVRKIVSALVKAKGYPADGVRGDVAQ